MTERMGSNEGRGELTEKSLHKDADDSPRPRPRFHRLVRAKPAEIEAAFRAALPGKTEIRSLHLSESYVEILPSDERQHFWSPQLAMRLEEQGDETLVHARFGPHPHVWALYLACYALSALLAIACLVYGAAQWMLGTEPIALYLTPIAILIVGLVYGASYVGQGLGAAQIFELRHFALEVLRNFEDEAGGASS